MKIFWTTKGGWQKNCEKMGWATKNLSVVIGKKSTIHWLVK